MTRLPSLLAAAALAAAATAAAAWGPGMVAAGRPAVLPAAPAAEVSGPCDEAEHAGDPRCAGLAPGTATTASTLPGDDDDDLDLPGP